MGADYTSGDLARATGNTVRTIRFYEEEGLLEPAEVSDGGHRRYTDDDLDRLKMIGDLRELGMSLCEIRDVLALRKGCSCVAEFAKRLESSLAGHVAEALRRIERLDRIRREIERTIGLVQSHLASPDGSLKPCDLSCGGDASKMLKILAPNDARCALHGSVEDSAAAAAEPARHGPVEGPAWTLEAGGTTRHQ